MSTLTKNKISLYKELQITQNSPDGVKMVYTCYEAIPNGGFCILSAFPENNKKINLKSTTYTKKPLPLSEKTGIEFFPSLIEAINAYNTSNSSNVG